MVIFSHIRKEKPFKNDKEEPESLKLEEKLDSGALFDRFATRFGAFAIVAVICYPLVDSSMAIFSALPYSLPGLESHSGSFNLLFIFTAMMLLFTIVLGFSTVSPILSWFEIKAKKASVLKAAALGIALALVIFFYILVVAILLSSEEFLPTLKSDTNLLRNISVCATADLSGEFCERAIIICNEAAGSNACIEAVGRYVDTLPDNR